ncbi:MAG TPA: hypothetical protein VIT45_08615 [Allosphingosinicella sp.]
MSEVAFVRYARPMNKLFYGDNLDVLREHIADESVDLIYLDPPFNSTAWGPPRPPARTRVGT